jgi:hypothetical protein
MVWPVAVVAIAAVAPASDAGPADVERGSVGANLRISGLAASAAEAEAAIAYNPDDDQFLVVWRDTRNQETTGWDIYGQRLSSSGTRLGGNFRISGAGASVDEWHPDVAYNPASGQYFVVWQDNRDLGDRGFEVYLQRVSRNGARVGGNVRLSGPTATDSEQSPAVAVSDSGGVLVVWMDGRKLSLRGNDIYGQRVTRNGGRLGPNFRISDTEATGDESQPDVAFSSASGVYLVVWQDSRDLSTRGHDVYARRVTVGGARLGPEVRVSGALALKYERYPAVACSLGGPCLIVWHDDRSHDPDGWEVFGQRMSAAATRLGANLRITGGAATGDDMSPSVAFEATSGRFLVVWHSARDFDARGWDVYSQWLSTGGLRVGASSRVSGGAATADETSTAVACRETPGLCLAAWGDWRNADITAPDIYGQRLAP